MNGLDFVGFVILLVISGVVSAALHFGLKIYVIPGWTSFISKVVIGSVGAWLGSPIFGHWFEGLSRGDVYYVPAVLGSAALLILTIDATQSIKGASSST